MSANDGLSSATVVPAGNTLALLEVLDRSGAVLQSQRVQRWPVTVGRAIDCDLVLSDPHIAAQHLRIGPSLPAAPEAAPTSSFEAAVTELAPVRVQPNAHGPLSVEVLDTVNGVRHGHARHARGSRFEWQGTEDLQLGRQRLRLRLADAELAPEQLLARFRWRSIGATLGLVLIFVALTMWDSWLDNSELNRFGLNAGKLIAFTGGVTLVWAGLAALLSKLFTGVAHFWRHTRIVLGVTVAAGLIATVLTTTAFATGWVPLARLAPLVDWWALAVGLLMQWWVVSSPRRKWLQTTLVSCFVLLGLGATAWFYSRDNQGEPYLARLYPPAWRMATTVPVSQWLQDSQGLRQRLDERLQNADEDESPDTADSEEDTEE